MSFDFSKIPSPCFVVDESLLRINLEILKMVQDEAGVEIICALKGYSVWSTFPLLKKYLSGATASSLNEARLVSDEMGVKAHTYCPVFLDEEFDDILRYSSHISFNSLSQFNRFLPKIKAHHGSVSLGLRINPEYSEVETDLYNPAMPGSRLGITAGELGDNLPEGVEGLHFHVLCENDSFVLERTLAKVEEKFGNLIKRLKWFNMGGGHHITRKDYDLKHLVDLLKDFRSRYTNLESVILEPGEAIGWHTGYLVSTVQDILDKKDMKIAMLDVSFAAHMPDCLEMPYKPKVLGATDPIAGQPVYRLGGSTCLAGDYMGMGDYSFGNGLQIGDRVVFDDMIHYTMVKTTFFNGVKHPAIGMFREDGSFVLLRTFSHEDYKKKLS
ncbi:MAG TPA: carboxynorspermidine decarboxylase [Bacteroidales bacterium]|nr:carboxynorspermidine decarboxylase [Bacteroidales bacterium]